MVAFNEYGQGYFTFEEFYELDVVQKVLKQFVPEQRDKAVNYLFKTYKMHLSSMGTEMRKKHTLNQIKQITFKDNMFQVYYKNGNWYNYTLAGEWY